MTYSDQDSIERCPHDQENPYVMISRTLIRDKTISANCRMVIIFLLSNTATWNIRIVQLYHEFKEFIGRDAMYNIINEAIEAGYIKRDEYIVKGLRRYKYYLSESPKFKKCLPLPENQDTENQDTENQGTKERISKEKISKKKEYPKESIEEKKGPKKVRPVSIDSTPFQGKDFEVDISSSEVMEILELEPKTKEYFRPDVMNRWMKKFGPKLVLEALKFFFKIKQTQSKPISKPEAWMEVALKKNYVETDQHCMQNKEFAQNLKKQYGLASLKINKRYCQDMLTGKDFYYYLPSEFFESQLKKLTE